MRDFTVHTPETTPTEAAERLAKCAERLAKCQDVPADVIDALRTEGPMPEAKLEALRAFTRSVVVNRGWASDADVAAFLAAGYGKQQVLEVVLGVALKAMSNYTNRVLPARLWMRLSSPWLGPIRGAARTPLRFDRPRSCSPRSPTGR